MNVSHLAKMAKMAKMAKVEGGRGTEFFAIECSVCVAAP
jgi:hypothetical protein